MLYVQQSPKAILCETHEPYFVDGPISVEILIFLYLAHYVSECFCMMFMMCSCCHRYKIYQLRCVHLFLESLFFLVHNACLPTKSCSVQTGANIASDMNKPRFVPGRHVAIICCLFGAFPSCCRGMEEGHVRQDSHDSGESKQMLLLLFVRLTGDCFHCISTQELQPNFMR